MTGFVKLWKWNGNWESPRFHFCAGTRLPIAPMCALLTRKIPLNQWPPYFSCRASERERCRCYHVISKDFRKVSGAATLPPRFRALLKGMQNAMQRWRRRRCVPSIEGLNWKKDATGWEFQQRRGSSHGTKMLISVPTSVCLQSITAPPPPPRRHLPSLPM